MPASRARSRGSKALVIDASIMQASGDATATHPTGTNCRDFLQCVLQICHRVVLTPALGQEWSRHRSRFASTWRLSMEARKKVLRLSAADLPAISGMVLDAIPDGKPHDAAEKDLHLIQAALATDRIVASLDDGAKCNFAAAAARVPDLALIRWVNPIVEPEDVIEALRPENTSRLGAPLLP